MVTLKLIRTYELMHTIQILSLFFFFTKLRLTTRTTKEFFRNKKHPKSQLTTYYSKRKDQNQISEFQKGNHDPFQLVQQQLNYLHEKYEQFSHVNL